MAELRAPKGLSKQARTTWRRITAAYMLSADGLLVLEGAMREWDHYIATGRGDHYKNFLASLRHLGISASEGDA